MENGQLPAEGMCSGPVQTSPLLTLQVKLCCLHVAVVALRTTFICRCQSVFNFYVTVFASSWCQ